MRAHAHDIAAYQHPHVFHYTGADIERRTIRVVALTVVMMGAEIVAGWLFNSMALLADGWHMSTHAAALGISWLAFVLARRHTHDRRFAFGTWKIEILGGFVSAILLGGVATAMVVLSLQRLLHPVTIQFDQAIFVAVIGLVVNLASMFLLADRHHHAGHAHPHGHHDHPHDHQPANLNLRAAYLHVIADALTSVLAIAALLGGKYAGWTWLDPIMGIVGAIMIANWTRSLLVDTGNILLDRESNDDLAQEVRTAVESDGDARISDLHLWRVGQNKYACILAVVANRPLAVGTCKARLRDVHELAHVTVEIVPSDDTTPASAPRDAPHLDSEAPHGH
jgi:cation diffusion facilitator family transporter